MRHVAAVRRLIPEKIIDQVSSAAPRSATGYEEKWRRGTMGVGRRNKGNTFDVADE